MLLATTLTQADPANQDETGDIQSLLDEADTGEIERLLSPPDDDTGDFGSLLSSAAGAASSALANQGGALGTIGKVAGAAGSLLGGGAPAAPSGGGGKPVPALAGIGSGAIGVLLEKLDRERLALAAKERVEHDLLFADLTGDQRVRLEDAIKVGGGPAVYRQIQAERRTPRIKIAPKPKAPPPPAPSSKMTDEVVNAIEALAATPEFKPPSAASLRPTTTRYDDSAGPEDEEENVGDAVAARPRPVRHIALIPFQRHQLEAMLRLVPVLQKLDKRSLQLLAGRTSTAHDVSGVDAATRTYHAEAGETATGIARQLTGNPQRCVELIASNPGHRDGDPWRIPPGWLAFNRSDDTGAITTQRKYVVANGDFPMKIADKLGAKTTHPAWWKELKAANPDKSTVDGGANWSSLIAGEELGVPDSWPDSQLAVPNGTFPMPSIPSPIPGAPPLPMPAVLPGGVPSFPGFPAANATQDPGVTLQAQGMLALFAQQHPGACNPPDFGKTIADFTGTTTPRTQQATQSFQVFFNQANPMSPLRMDGVLDDATDKALFAMTVGQIPKPMPLPGAPSGPSPSPMPGLPPATPLPAPIPQLPQANVPQGLPQLQLPQANLPQPSAQPLPGAAPGGPLGTQVPGLPPGWTWTTPQGPFGMPWQAPATPIEVVPASDMPRGSATSSSSDGDLAPAALALAVGLALL